jgi:OOP family OmpA-OmpF porin
MKKHILISVCFVLTFSLSAQTAERRNNFSAGFGFQEYRGDLGNSFFDFESEWYGVARISYSRYLNKSFDGQLSLAVGDYGRCTDDEETPPKVQRSQLFNLNTRLNALMISAKYKFANGYLLKENSKLAPYVFAGLGLNNLVGGWAVNRVHIGNYTSINAGAGITYNITERFNINLNMTLGYFTKDDLDYITQGNNDMYMQNTLSLGINL